MLLYSVEEDIFLSMISQLVCNICGFLKAQYYTYLRSCPALQNFKLPIDGSVILLPMVLIHFYTLVPCMFILLAYSVHYFFYSASTFIC